MAAVNTISGRNVFVNLDCFFSSRVSIIVGDDMDDIYECR
mgnify:CR=1 FL=1